MANLGLMQPISAYYDELADKYGAAYLDVLKYQGEYYGINLPWNETTTLRYNRTLFEEYGVKTPKEYFLEGTWDWDAFRTCLHEITRDTDGDGVNNTIGTGFYMMTCFAPSIAEDEDGRIHSLLNTDKNRDLYQMLYEEFSLNKTMNSDNYTLQTIILEYRTSLRTHKKGGCGNHCTWDLPSGRPDLSGKFPILSRRPDSYLVGGLDCKDENSDVFEDTELCGCYYDCFQSVGLTRNSV